MTIAKGLSSGYQPIGGSIVSDAVAHVIGQGEFNHGYTYSSHPVAAAVALENLRILQEEHIVDNVRTEAAPYLANKWRGLADHPLVGEASVIGMMGSLALTPHKESLSIGRACPSHSPKARKSKKKKRRRQEPFDLHAMLTEQTVPVPLFANVQADTKSTAKHAD